MRDTPFSDQRSRFLAGAMGVRLFLVSLAMLFAAGLLAFVVARLKLTEKDLWPADLPPLPRLLWLSTAILIVSSVTIQWALNSIKAGNVERLRTGLLLTLLLAMAFLLVQARCWLTWLAPVSQRWSGSDEYRFALTSFYVLTGLHALHVLGGLLPMAIAAKNAFLGAYTQDDFASVKYTAMYWHFLGAVWVVLYGVLLIGL